MVSRQTAAARMRVLEKVGLEVAGEWHCGCSARRVGVWQARARRSERYPAGTAKCA